jgi:SutA RNAP-binding domain
MKRNGDKTSTAEKNRIRNEIEAQVQEYLQQGGKIHVVGARQAGSRAIGPVWHGQDEMTGLGQ